MIVLNDSYGTGLAKYVTEAFEAAGGEVVAAPTYNTVTPTSTRRSARCSAADPDAIALITFDEVSHDPARLCFGQFPAEQPVLRRRQPEELRLTRSPRVRSRAPRAPLPGLTIDSIGDFTGSSTSPGRPRATPRSRTTPTRLSPTTRSSCSRSRRSPPARPTAADIAAKLQEVSGGSGDGEKCTTYADCAAIIIGGGVADYDGISGPITFDEDGDPTEATIGIYQYGADNNYSAASRLSSTDPITEGPRRGPGPLPFAASAAPLGRTRRTSRDLPEADPLFVRAGWRQRLRRRACRGRGR